MSKLDKPKEMDATGNSKTIDKKKDIVSEWLVKFESNKLNANDFRNYWALVVPNIIKLDEQNNTLDWSKIKKEEKKLLIPLEKFIFGENSEKVLHDLCEQNYPSVCGRIFNIKESKYSCQECKVNDSCVLCEECFLKSSHINHRYKIVTSNHGVFCDCGDIEAWKQDTHCQTHQHGLKEKSVNFLTKDMVIHAHLAFEYVLQYVSEMVTLQQHLTDEQIQNTNGDNLFKSIYTNLEDTYCLVFENDQHVTRDKLELIFAYYIGCSKQECDTYIKICQRGCKVILKYASLASCEGLKSSLDKRLNASCTYVKFTIVHSRMLAHNLYACSLLEWMLPLLKYSEQLRAIFSKVLSASTSKGSILENLLKNDNILWKSARLCWHKLIVTGIFMEYESKKEFSITFTNNYGKILKDFINNDIDYVYSIASFGVQVFTTPRIANYLVVHQDALYKVLDTFLSVCAPHVNKENKLEFKQTLTTRPFRKIILILDDVRYLFDYVPKPDAWNKNLRVSFSHAISLFIKLLDLMEYMTIANIQLHQYWEDKEEWETAFVLNVKLKPIIAKILLWCRSDITILNTVYRMTLKNIMKNPISKSDQPTKVENLLSYKANCIKFDVSNEPVSLHFPLTRFFTALHVCLGSFDLGLEHCELRSVKKMSVQIIEPILRVQRLISQENSQSLNFNKGTLFNQLRLYCSSKYRTEMLDKDIVMLQIGASLINSNQFLIHLLNKFDLLTWANANFKPMTLNKLDEDSQLSYVLVKHLLTLIVVIVGERYVPNVGQVTYHDCIKKEVIQQLCISPMTYSKLIETLNPIIEDEECLVKAINEVAIFKKMNGEHIYELNPIYNNVYNVFYYHYSKEQRFVSENNNIKLRKMAGELQCSPPPDIPLFNKAFSNVANIMKCDIMLHIMKSVLETPLKCSNISSGSNIRLVLHLIGYALHEEEKQSSFAFTRRSKPFNIETALDELQHNPVGKAYKDLIKWTLIKFRQISSSESKNNKTKSEEIDESIEIKEQRISKLVTERRATIIAEMTQIQNKFINDNAKLFGNVTLKLHDNVTENICDNKYTCILCQEEQVVSYKNQTMILPALIQTSSVLCQVFKPNVYKKGFSEQYYMPANFGPSPYISTCGHSMHITCWNENIDSTYPMEGLTFGSFILPVDDEIESEYNCPLCKSIYNTVIPLLPSISTFSKPKIEKTFNKDIFDWLKELKFTLNQINIVDHSTLIFKQESPMHNVNDTLLLKQICAVSDETDGPKSLQFSIKADEYYKGLPTPPLGVHTFLEEANSAPPISTDLVKTILKFVENTYTKVTCVNKPHSHNNQIPLMTWRACAYTIHSIEVVLRYKNKSLLGDLSFSQKACLKALVRVSEILSPTLHNVHDINLHAFRLLSIAINNGGNNSIGILDWDAFGMLVALTMTMPSLYYTSNHLFVTRETILDFNILSLMFITSIVQIILTIDIQEVSDEILEMNTIEAEDTYYIANLVYKLRGISIKNTIAVWNLIQSSSVPFLRCCSIFYHFLTEIPASDILKEVNGDTYNNLCSYLGLPTSCKELLDKPYVEMLIDKWAENEKLIEVKQGGKLKFRSWNHINELVKLPNNYSELINIVLMSKCKNYHDELSSNPIMCLVCGAILFCSPMKSTCLQDEQEPERLGPCSSHSYNCSRGLGVFFCVSSCEVLLLPTPDDGVLYQALYVDEYGEIDIKLKRGNPLYLSKDAYKEFQTKWHEHKLLTLCKGILSRSSTIDWESV